MIKPTIGRVVWYYPDGKAQFAIGVQPYAALIAFVHSDDCINVAYFDANGVAKSNTSVKLLQEGEETPEGCFCVWMPYQVGQAARTQELEKKIEEAK